MTRRESLLTLAIASSGTLFLAGCTEADAISFIKDGKLDFNKRHIDYLSQISEAILPTQHLGEKVSPPIDFIMTEINQGMSSEDILKFATGFDQYKLMLKENKLRIKPKFSTLLADKALEQLEASEPQDEMIFFINNIKSLSVRHLKNSQLYQEEVMNYKLVPERYDGCIPA